MKRYDACILIVDDDPNDRLLIERAFRKVGVKTSIHTVGSVAEAMAYIKGLGKYADREAFRYPTFIMTDLEMPLADGLDLLRFVKENTEGGVIPTVVFSSSTDPEDVRKCYLLGASSYHVKPTTFEALRSQLQVLHAYWTTCFFPETAVVDGQSCAPRSTAPRISGHGDQPVVHDSAFPMPS